MKAYLGASIVIAFMLASGCAFKHVRFDNNTTYEDKAQKIRISERDVRVSAQFSMHDAVVNDVQKSFGLTLKGAATLTRTHDALEDAEAARADVLAERAQLEEVLVKIQTIEGILQEAAGTFRIIMETSNTAKGSEEAWTVFQTNFMKNLEGIQSSYRDRAFQRSPMRWVRPVRKSPRPPSGRIWGRTSEPVRILRTPRQPTSSSAGAKRR